MLQNYYKNCKDIAFVTLIKVKGYAFLFILSAKVDVFGSLLKTPLPLKWTICKKRCLSVATSNMYKHKKSSMIKIFSAHNVCSMHLFTTINMKLLLKYLIDNHIFCNFAAEN